MAIVTISHTQSVKHLQLAGGILRAGNVNYAILLNTASVIVNPMTGMQETQLLAGGVRRQLPIQNGVADVYEDDFEARYGRHSAPTTRVNTEDGSGMFDLMQSGRRRGTNREKNRFADAYIEPEYVDLEQFNTRPSPTGTINAVTSAPHLPTALPASPNDLATTLDQHISSFAQDSRMLEDDLYWVSYVTTAYEYAPEQDLDPDYPIEDQNLGISLPHYSFVFLESIRDESDRLGMSFGEAKARVTTHEIAHQFDLAVGAGADANGHRTGGNVMNQFALTPELDEFYFHLADVLALRLRTKSPGEL